MEKTLGCTRDRKYGNVNIVSSTTERINTDKSGDIFRGHYYGLEVTGRFYLDAAAVYTRFYTD